MNNNGQNERSLPDGWEWKTVGEISESINPGFLSGRHNQESIGVPHIRPMNISRSGEIELSLLKYVQETDYLPLMKGDVLFNNTNSPELVGKTTFIPKDTNWAYSNHMTRIRLRKEIANPAWVAKCLHYLYVDGFFKLNCRHHVNQASIGSGFLSKEVSIPLPPLPEQERIVSRIEELLSDLDVGMASLKRVRVGLKRYKASVLKAAVSGNLVNGKLEIGEGELPDRWRWVRFAELISDYRSGSTAVPKDIPSHYPILRSSSVRPRSIDYTDIRYLSQENSQKSSHFLEYGDLLFTRLSGSLDYVGNGFS